MTYWRHVYPLRGVPLQVIQATFRKYFNFLKGIPLQLYIKLFKVTIFPVSCRKILQWDTPFIYECLLITTYINYILPILDKFNRNNIILQIVIYNLIYNFNMIDFDGTTKHLYAIR